MLTLATPQSGIRRWVLRPPLPSGRYRLDHEAVADAPEPSLYAEAIRATREAVTCAGNDFHRMGMPLTIRGFMTVAGVAVALLSVIYLPLKALAYPTGLGLGVAVLGGFGGSMNGDRLKLTFWGMGRSTSLSAVTHVGVSTVGVGSQYLRLFVGSQMVRTTPPIVGPRGSMPATKRRHLAIWLDRPGVTWDPGARELLNISDPALSS